MNQDETLYKEAIAYLKALFDNNAGGHGLDHTLRVCHNAILLAQKESDCNESIVKLAALFHDADDHKLFATENNENARAFLADHQIPSEMVDRICTIINEVSFSQNKGRSPLTLEGKIVQDADRLDAIGAIGIARTFAYGGEHGRSIEESIQHFYDKLLLLKDLMNTEAARQIAKERHAFLEQYLQELKKEL